MRTIHSGSRNSRSRGPFAGKKLARREFIKLSGAGLAGAALLGVAGCGGGGARTGGDEIVFSFFPDPTGSVQKLIDKFNQQNGGIRVKLREMPPTLGSTSISSTPSFRPGRRALT